MSSQSEGYSRLTLQPTSAKTAKNYADYTRSTVMQIAPKLIIFLSIQTTICFVLVLVKQDFKRVLD